MSLNKNIFISSIGNIAIQPFLIVVRLCIISYAISYAIFGAYYAAITLMAGLIIFEPFIRLLIRNKKINAARLLFISSCNFYIISSSALFLNSMNTEYYFLPTFLLSLILFKPNEKKYIAFSSLLTIGVILAFLYFTKIPEDLIFSGYFPYEKFKIVNLFGAIFIAALFLMYFIDKYSALFVDRIEAEYKNRKRLELIIEGAQVGCWDWNIKDNSVSFDENWCKMLGLDFQKTEQALHTWEKRVHPDDIAQAYEDINRHLKGESKYYENVHRMQHIDGSWVWILDRGKIYEYDENGLPIRFAGVHINISKHKEVENELENAQKIARIGNWSFDIKTGKIHWSKQIFDFFSVKNGKEPTFDEHLNSVNPEDVDIYKQAIEKCIKVGTPYRVRYRIKSNNIIKWLEGVGSADKDINGNVIRLFGTCQDITEQVNREEENRLIIDSLNIGIWKFYPQTNELKWDKSMFRLFGINEKDFPHHYSAWENSLTQSSKEKAVKELEEALSGKKEFNTTFEIINNGHKRFIGGRGIVFRDSENKPILMYGINWDRTKDVLQENSLIEVKNLNESISNSAKFSIITTNLDGIITSFSKEAEIIIGYNANEVIGKHTPALFHDPSEIETTAKILSKEYNLKIPVGFETFVYKARNGSFDERRWTYIHKSGKKVPVLLNVTGLYDPNNKLYGFLGIAKDISQQIELEQSLLHEKVKSIHNAKLASLGEMSAGIAHEINNPLAIIKTNMSQLTEIVDDAVIDRKTIKKMASTVVKTTDRIAKIVRGLRNFSRDGSRDSFEIVNLKSLMEEIELICFTRFRDHGVLLIDEIPDNIIFEARSTQISEVLVNLINNSYDAIANLEDRWIKLNSEIIDNTVYIHVTDSGDGIPMEIQKKIFQPFYTTKDVGKGTGMGLSISHGIIQVHQGELYIDNKCKNTRFTIRLPVSQQSNTAA